MSKQVQEAYIVAATRTPIGRSHRGYFRNTRPDDLLATALRAALAQVPGLTLVGTAREKASVLSFTLAHAHPHDVGTILDAEGIAIRTGHHCAQPVMTRLGLPATARASVAFYNTPEEAAALEKALRKIVEVFGS